jgi:hypothetical protein
VANLDTIDDDPGFRIWMALLQLGERQKPQDEIPSMAANVPADEPEGLLPPCSKAFKKAPLIRGHSEL